MSGHPQNPWYYLAWALVAEKVAMDNEALRQLGLRHIRKVLLEQSPDEVVEAARWSAYLLAAEMDIEGRRSKVANLEARRIMRNLEDRGRVIREEDDV